MIQLLAGVAIIENRKILLLQNIGSDDQNGKYGPPAGHGEPGETPEETAIRETKEETNLDVDLVGIVQVGYFSYKERDYVFVFYLAKAKDLKSLKLQGKEVSGHVWASLLDLENDKFEFRKKFLKEPVEMALKGRVGKSDMFKIYKIES